MAKNRHLAERLARVKPQVTITSDKGKKEFESDDYYIRPYKFTQLPHSDISTLINMPGDPAPPSWLGKYDKYDWTAPVVV